MGRRVCRVYRESGVVKLYDWQIESLETSRVFYFEQLLVCLSATVPNIKEVAVCPSR
jgi:hypothetical protein